MRAAVAYVRIPLMKNPKIFLLLILTVFSAGCFFKRSPEHLTIEKPEYRYINTGTIVELDALKSGGKILIVPFVAGAGVPADDRLDRIALHLIKGVADALAQSDAPLDVVTGPEAEAADFIIKGHVTEIEEPGKLRRWTMTGRSISLGIQAKMTGRRNQNEIATFAYRREGPRSQSFEELGYRIGLDIGNFLIKAGDDDL